MKVDLNGTELTGVSAMSVSLDRAYGPDGKVHGFHTVAHVLIERDLGDPDDASIAPYDALTKLDEAASMELTFTQGGGDLCVIELNDLKITSVVATLGNPSKETISGAAGVMRMTNPVAGMEFKRDVPLFND
ncbi:MULTISPECIES: hypothetical protein [unclassified Rhizobium]|uniref:hypothetical protein n=1 Tax=unclassified Rhizobium TaxID=2613769 RepID=UPI0007E92FA2|nr:MULTISPECIES: hypothetical protein [unclassified Rhizobium]ANM09241.1 hypothetical protein AMK05_CH00812 [Rhizobium sp. N324]OYD02809.1 hypothetical protein AMK08_CH100808 [Rhizobium sp. N4311]